MSERGKGDASRIRSRRVRADRAGDKITALIIEAFHRGFGEESRIVKRLRRTQAQMGALRDKLIPEE